VTVFTDEYATDTFTDLRNYSGYSSTECLRVGELLFMSTPFPLRAQTERPKVKVTPFAFTGGVEMNH